MPILLPPDLPATAILRAEGCPVALPGADALRIAFLNLMPDKTRTEAQFARCLAWAGPPVELVLARLGSYRPRHALEHVDRFYTTIDAVLGAGVDALIVTGAPVETMPFADVAYWSELSSVMAEARSGIGHRLYVCWAAQAALFAAHGIPKVRLGHKAFGIYDQTVLRPDIDLMTRMPRRIPTPVSRHTETRTADLEGAGLTLLALSQETGPALAQSLDGRDVYSFNHLEYDRTALRDEYRRDLLKGIAIAPPHRCWCDGDPPSRPDPRWDGIARGLFTDWVNRLARERSLRAAGHDRARRRSITDLAQSKAGRLVAAS